ncbi:GNAT family N-acetyltransferase [uncultured Friedmanniella sp.]|uniref:GNAT family N-acetyltransferase n=1 Tax=uncultured Friedmanniella sp. TaxID=335381 RepID=UPI0035CC39FE
MTSTSGPLADSVRIAWPAEAAAVAELQRRVWDSELAADVAEALLAEVSTADMTLAWEQAISRPPQARYRVLVAVADARVVGFATTVPGQDPDADEAADGEVGEFAVDPPARHRGHGSRLLNACADTLRADGFRQARWWVGEANEELRGFLAAAGWVPDGSSREIGSDDESVRLSQIRLHTDLSVE